MLTKNGLKVQKTSFRKKVQKLKKTKTKNNENNPKCLETCVNCVTKWVTDKIYPMKVRILQIIIFQSNFMYNLSHFSTSLRPDYQNSFFLNIFLFFTLNSRMSKNMCIWCRKLYNSKTGVGPTFTWSNEP